MASSEATGRKRHRQKSLTDSERKKRKRQWNRDNPHIRIGKQCSRWKLFIEENNLTSNEAATRLLLDNWYSSLPQEVHSEGSATPTSSATEQISSDLARHVHVMTSTPSLIPHTLTSRVTPMPMSDVSDIEARSSHSSNISGVEELYSDSDRPKEVSLMTRYEEKAKEADTSFIEVTLIGDSDEDEADYPQSDPSYILSHSDIEEEEEYDMELDMDLDLEMSLSLPKTRAETLHLPLNTDPIDMEGVEVDDELQEDECRDGDVNIETDAVGEKKSICFERALLELASVRVPTNCQRKACGGTISIKCRYIGCAVQLQWKCSNGHNVHTWDSQPRLKKVYLGNFLLSVTILASGNNYSKVALLAKFLNLAMIGQTSHQRVQRVFTVPIINSFFEDVMQKTLAKYQGKDIVVAGDGRNDSPGHSAMYCTYTLLEYESKDIVAFEIVEKRETQLKSTLMEKEGLIRAMESIKNRGANIVEVCTDAHVSIAHYLKQTFPDMKHSYDIWHGAKNLGKKVTAIASEARNKELRPWVPNIINHFWYCARKSQGDESALASRWRGILHHVTNVHEWNIGDASGPAQCEHDELEEAAPDEESKWIDCDGDAHHALEKLVFDTRFLHTLKYYVNFRHTGELENFHEHILMYAAKRFAYSYPMYKARNQLAVIDYQMHKDRQQATNDKGEPMYVRKYSKRNKNWSAVPVKEKKTYKYIPDLLRNAVKALEEHVGPLPSRFPLEGGDPRLIQKTLAEVSPLSTKELVARQKSRFQD